MRFLPLIFKNTLRNRRRSLLTICSIAASFCLLGVLFAMYSALYLSEPTPGQALRLITRNRVSLTQIMPAYYKQKIAAVPGVRHLYSSQWFGGTYKDDRDQRNFFARFAVEPEDFFKVETGKQVPEDQKQAFIRERKACLVGRGIANKFGWKIGDTIPLKGDIFPGDREFVIRAIYDSTEENETMFFHMESLYQSLPVTRRDFAGTFNILVNTKDDVPTVQKAVDALFENAPVQTRTETEQAFLLSFTSFLGNVKVFLFAICGAVTFTVLLVSANTMAMTVRERVREVGVLKTLGFTEGRILGIIISEAMFIAAVGAAAGCLLAAFLIRGVAAVAGGFSFQLKTMTLTPAATMTCLALGLVVGLLAAIVPAYSASRTPILDSLRYTG